jgi:hypothetical protein
MVQVIGPILSLPMAGPAHESSGGWFMGRVQLLESLV